MHADRDSHEDTGGDEPKYDCQRQGDDISDGPCEVEKEEEVAEEAASKRGAVESKTPSWIGVSNCVFIHSGRRFAVGFSPGGDKSGHRKNVGHWPERGGEKRNSG